MTTMYTRLALGAGIVLVNLSLTLWAQTQTRIYAGVAYRFPTAVGPTGTVLMNDGLGNLSWTGVAVPSNVIAWSLSGTCPGGWTEYTTGRGRVIVGLVAGGVNDATVGTALTNTEDRVTGLHTHPPSGTHTHTQSAHGHTVDNPNHGHSETGSVVVDANSGGGSITTGLGATTTGGSTSGVSLTASTATNASATTGVTVNDAGSVANTNAPYIQLIACKKS